MFLKHFRFLVFFLTVGTLQKGTTVNRVILYVITSKIEKLTWVIKFSTAVKAPLPATKVKLKPKQRIPEKTVILAKKGYSTDKNHVLFLFTFGIYIKLMLSEPLYKANQTLFFAQFFFPKLHSILGALAVSKHLFLYIFLFHSFYFFLVEYKLISPNEIDEKKRNGSPCRRFLFPKLCVSSLFKPKKQFECRQCIGISPFVQYYVSICVSFWMSDALLLYASNSESKRNAETYNILHTTNSAENLLYFAFSFRLNLFFSGRMNTEKNELSNRNRNQIQLNITILSEWNWANRTWKEWSNWRHERKKQQKLYLKDI